jgi:NAD(P)H-dependent FMN reductase
MNILTVSGSLRAGSSNVRALEAVSLLTPHAWNVRAAPPLDALPHFNPDVEQAGLPDAASRWRADIAWADAVIISSPEYAHGVPGVLKNALDWLVGGTEICHKPVALFNATPPAEFAHAQLRETLRVMGADVIETASIALPLRGRPIDTAGIAADPQLASAILRACEALTLATAASKAKI